MIEKALADEKVQAGWMRLWLAFEVVAKTEEKSREALEFMIKKLEEDPRVKMYRKEFSESKRIENPLKNVREGYSVNCEVEIITQNFDNMVMLTIEYGPSSIEIMEPSKFEMDLGQAQGILNSISQMMHRFAAAGIGGIILLGGQEQ